MNHVKKNRIKRNENEREMNGQKLIIQCAQNVKNLSFFDKQISKLFHYYNMHSISIWVSLDFE
jgi:hypothetical protein